MKHLTKYFTVFAVAAGLLYLPDFSAAQHSRSTIDTSKVYKLHEVIISASRYEEKPSSVGRNVTVISKQEIEQSIHYSVAGLLAEQQGMHMVGEGQTFGSLQQGFLRNANSNHSIVMIDGVRISDPSTVNNGVDLSELSLLGVERIEIVRGSHSTLYGSSAIGGVVNIITQKQSTTGFNVDLETQHGVFGKDTYSTQNNVTANYMADNGLYVDAGLSQQFSNGLDATVDTSTISGSFNPQDQDDFRKLDLMGKVGYKTSKADIYLSYRNEDQTSDLDQGAFVDDNNARVDFKRDLLSYGTSYHFNSLFKIGYQGAYSNLNRNFVNDSSVVDGQGNFDGTFVETDAEGTSWENSLTTTFAANYLKSIVGLESVVQTMTSRNYTFSRSQFGVFEQTTDLDSLDLKETINSAFIHTEINGGLFNESLEAVSLILGSRLSDHNEFGTHVTYEINPKVQVSPYALIYGSITTGYNAPSLYQLNTPEQGFGAFTSRGNPNLDPEKSVSYELGWKQEVGSVLDFRLSLFKTKVRDVIEYVYLWDGNATVSDLSSGDYLGDTYINISQQDVNGLEFGMNVQPEASFSFGGNITFTESTLTFAPGDIDEGYTGGNHVQVFESGAFVTEERELEGLTRRPQVSALIRATYQPLTRLQFKVTSRFVGSRDDIFYSASLGPFGAQDRSKVDDYNLTDISASYQITRQISVIGKVENLLDTSYQEINGFQTRGRGFFLKASLSL